jgi:hypothetical protein
MAFERKDNTGAVFQNQRKEKDTHPDRTGDAMIDGREYWVNGWIKQDRNGKQFLSLAFKPKDQQSERVPDRVPPAGVQPPMGNAPQGRRSSMKDSMDDEIPFAPEWR